MDADLCSFLQVVIVPDTLSNLPEAQLALVSQLSTLNTYIYNTCIHEVAELVGCLFNGSV